MQNENDITREKCIKTVSIIGVIANVFLLCRAITISRFPLQNYIKVSEHTRKK